MYIYRIFIKKVITHRISEWNPLSLDSQMYPRIFVNSDFLFYWKMLGWKFTFDYTYFKSWIFKAHYKTM